jgi:antitoxin component YwqK of YwqJK toxin-antitoxin module
VNLKIPGNAFVVGSEAGFKMTADLSKVNQSRIIFTDKFEGELKAAEFYENGNLKKAQIMLPSKFRDNNGKLIQFIDDKGIPNPLYVEKTESGTLKLKADMIDSELLNLTSFRIPTSY